MPELIDDSLQVYATEDPMMGYLLENMDFFKPYFLDAKIDQQSIEKEERMTAEQDALTASGLFELARAPFRSYFRAMLKEVFDHFDISKEGGVDIGSGSTGEMVHEYLPLTPEQRRTWTECEVNPKAVELHKLRHSSANIRLGSYLRLRESLGLTNPVNTITGLSSLDATNHLNEALQEIKDSLSVGGFLVHMQDVRPGIHYGIKEMQRRGYCAPYKCIIGPLEGKMAFPNPYGFLLETPKGHYAISSAEFFRQALGRTIETIKGFRLLFNQWLTCIGPYAESDEFSENFLAILKKSPNPNHKQTYAVVTVAQRND